MQFVKSGYHGFFLPEAGVALDGPLPRDVEGTVFISHAHADHAPRSRKSEVCATPATAALIRARGHRGPVREIPFGETLHLPSASVTLYPAGHILGSAMIFVESEYGTLLYTGDCRTPPSPTSEGFEMPDRHIDHLIIEATFALPIYKWAPHRELFDRIRRFVHQTLEDGATPVMLCYNLGKAQEVMHALAFAEAPGPPIQVQIHKDGAPLCRVYEQFGVNLGCWEVFDPETLPGKVLITPGNTVNMPGFNQIPNPRFAYVSGWAALENRSGRTDVGALIPLSDHLDFFELIDLCRKYAPGHVHLTHTPDSSVALHYLRKHDISCSDLKLMEPAASII